MTKKSTPILQKNHTTAKILKPKQEVIDFLIEFSKKYDPCLDLN